LFTFSKPADCLLFQSQLIVYIYFQAVKKITSRNGQSNIRSVSFQGNILTIGNGNGVVLFWDVRAGKHLESTMNTNRAVSLKASRGWVVSQKYLNYFF
jgi:hypothetical protein